MNFVDESIQRISDAQTMTYLMVVVMVVAWWLAKWTSKSSVIRFDEISPCWPNVKSVWHLFEGLFGIRQNFVMTVNFFWQIFIVTNYCSQLECRRFYNGKVIFKIGSCRGSVGIAVASKTRGHQFKSSHQQKFNNEDIYR